MTVKKNPDYWRQDDNGNQLPYLDEIEFRVIVDSQVRAAALEAGDVDLIATSDSSVVGNYVDSTGPGDAAAEQLRRDELHHVPPHPAAVPGPGRALRPRPGRRPPGPRRRRRTAGSAPSPTARSRPGQDGYLDDAGLPAYDPAAASAAIADWEAANGPLEINYSTTPTGTNKAIADYLQSAWGEVGVDVTQTPIEQSKLITNALLGSPEFFAFGWRNHAGLYVDTQHAWWHGFAADGFGGEAKDGGVALNFGRLNDPVINDLLDQARSEADPAARKALAQQINQRVRQAVLDPADVVDDVGHHHGSHRPEHRPHAAARR